MRRKLVSGLGALALTAAMASQPLAATRRFAASGSPGDFSWSPGIQRIERGDRIRWSNSLSGSHTVTAYGGNWSMNETVQSGESVGKRFRRAGTFRFRCTVSGHSSLSEDGNCTGMCGRVRVGR
jgi:plastocyanin